MSPRHRTQLAWYLWALTIGLTGAGFILLVLGWSTNLPDAYAFRGYPGLLALGFSSIGVLVALHRPEHRIGWIFLANGLIFGAQAFLQQYAAYALVTQPGILPDGLTAAWIQAWIWVPGMVLAVIFLPLLFPTGQLPSPRWRYVGWLAVLGTLLALPGFALDPGPLTNTPYAGNPIRVEAGEVWAVRLITLGLSLLVVSTILATASLVVRVQRASGDERQQLKWIASAAALIAAGIAVALPSDMLSQGGFKPPQILLLLAVCSMPIACGVAILRYRLYDIDVIIRRTLIYGFLSVALASVYLATILVLQRLFLVFTGEQSDLAIVASTLTIAALFQPLRRRIQRAIDRRFYRRRINAAEVLATFAVTARDEVDLGRLTGRLVEVVDEAVQPAHVSVWLTPSHRGESGAVGR